MTQRLNLQAVTPEGYRAVLGLEKYVRANIDTTLLHLVKMRASIINECSYCVDMHSRDALAAGEDRRRMFAVAAWRDAPFFDERERAALELTDAVTRLEPGGVPDDVWDVAAKHFDETELGNLLLAIVTINAWNRITVPTRREPPVHT
ncbi:carboxymuconolactone decarboxylase family protein [Jiangella asiatica]|uniref:Carboxymuconolactone decarboxylase family protein n=1 Tax=Jiangella asiatica TaxID=2530372 RepID=A0A4V2Z2U4_9ACTN|nr:carboxymuconolactone decarboxylase family protein [Jiangella asiatica]TDE10138.1 carboxymuconolactone decarboxylase family protein [Jiangella asiatica]